MSKYYQVQPENFPELCQLVSDHIDSDLSYRFGFSSQNILSVLSAQVKLNKDSVFGFSEMEVFLYLDDSSTRSVSFFNGPDFSIEGDRPEKANIDMAMMILDGGWQKPHVEVINHYCCCDMFKSVLSEEE